MSLLNQRFDFLVAGTLNFFGQNLLNILQIGKESVCGFLICVLSGQSTDVEIFTPQISVILVQQIRHQLLI